MNFFLLYIQNVTLPVSRATLSILAALGVIQCISVSLVIIPVKMAVHVRLVPATTLTTPAHVMETMWDRAVIVSGIVVVS